MTVTKYTLEEFYKMGLMNPIVSRNKAIKEKIASLPGKLSNRVRHVAYAMKLSTRTIYRALK